VRFGIKTQFIPNEPATNIIIVFVLKTTIVGVITILVGNYVYLYIKKIKMYLDNYMIDIKRLCQENRVKNLYVFGSVLTNRFNNNSDIDLVVDIDSNDPLDYADKYFNLKFALQDLLKRQIDLLENKAIKNPYIRENIDNSKSLIYGA
jgi:uncharacterized protein